MDCYSLYDSLTTGLNFEISGRSRLQGREDTIVHVFLGKLNQLPQFCRGQLPPNIPLASSQLLQ